MQGEFEMSIMGELNYFLGLQIKSIDKGTFVSQIKYFLELLKKYDMKAWKFISTSMDSNHIFYKNQPGLEIEITKYKGTRRFFLYLTACHPDMMFIVCMWARLQAYPRESHFKNVKPILMYLNVTLNHDL